MTPDDRQADGIERPDCPDCDDGGHMVACGVSVKWWECSRCGHRETRYDDGLRADGGTPQDGVEREQREWFGAYAPAEHINEASGAVAHGEKHVVEDVGAAGTDLGAVIVDAETVYGDTVRLVYEPEHLLALAEMFSDLAEATDGDRDE